MNYLCRSFLVFEKARVFFISDLHLSLVRRCSVFSTWQKDSTDVFFPKLPNIKFLVMVIFSHSSFHSTVILTNWACNFIRCVLLLNFKQIGVLYLYWRFYWHQNIHKTLLLLLTFLASRRLLDWFIRSGIGGTFFNARLFLLALHFSWIVNNCCGVLKMGPRSWHL